MRNWKASSAPTKSCALAQEHAATARGQRSFDQVVDILENFPLPLRLRPDVFKRTVASILLLLALAGGPSCPTASAGSPISRAGMDESETAKPFDSETPEPGEDEPSAGAGEPGAIAPLVPAPEDPQDFDFGCPVRERGPMPLLI